MIKFGVVQEGKTPSANSGKPSDKITREGEAKCKSETVKSASEKLSKSLTEVNLGKIICQADKMN